MPKLGLIHYNYASKSLDDFLKFTSETGFSYVELQIGDVWNSDVANPEQNAEAVRAQIEGYGLQVSALAAGNDFVVLEEETIQAQVARMERIAGLAKLLGTSVLRTEGGAAKDAVPESRWVEAMAGCLTRCLEFAERNEVYLAVDNHGIVTNDGDLQVELFERVRFQICRCQHRHNELPLGGTRFRNRGQILRDRRALYIAHAPQRRDGFTWRLPR